MSTAIPDLSPAEYQRRWDAVAARTETAGLDALVVTGPLEQTYLTGSWMTGDTAPWPLLIVPGERPVFLVRRYDEDAVVLASMIKDVVAFADTQDVMVVFADMLRRRGLDKGRIGFELGTWGLAPRDLATIERELPDMTVQDATRLVTAVSEVKSAEELAIMRQAMAWTELGMRTFFSSLAEGVTENEVAGRISEALFAAGSGLGETPPVLFGKRTALPHANSADNALRQGDVAFTEHSGWCRGYAAGLVRTAVLGRNPAAEELYKIAVEAQEAAIAAVRPGATAASIEVACRGVLKRHGVNDALRQRTGYAIGLRWLDRSSMSLLEGNDDPLVEDMTLHMPTILFKQGEFGIGVSETVRVAADGAEVMGGVPRELVLL